MQLPSSRPLRHPCSALWLLATASLVLALVTAVVDWVWTHEVYARWCARDYDTYREWSTTAHSSLTPRWLRYFERYETAAAQGPRYQLRPELWPPPVWVISLSHATDRRALLVPQLAGQNITFEFVDAVSGASPAGPFAALAEGLLRPHLPSRWLSPGQMGCLLSHVRLLHRLLASGAPLALILEDDARLLHRALLPAVRTALEGLPASWDLAFLQSCENIWGWLPGEKGPPADMPLRLTRHIRFSTCTLGLLVRPRFAARVLRELDLNTEAPIDLAYRYLEQAGVVHAVIFEPPLLGWAGGQSFIEP